MAYGNGHANGVEHPLALVALNVPRPIDIRPRPWVYGHLLLRGAVTLLVAPGGTGKTAVTTAITLACATGRSLLGSTPLRQLTLVNVALEESEEEMQRRFAAAMMHFSVEQEDIRGRILVHDARKSGFMLADIDPDTGQPHRLPAAGQLIDALRDLGCDVLTVDPLALCHGLEENNNVHMAFLIRLFNEIALTLDCAVLLVHHTRKGAAAGDPDGIRGAGALINHARIAVGLMPMSEDEAATMAIEPYDRKRTVRLDDLKRNYSLKSADAVWYRLESIALGNLTQDYPFGDSVQVPNIWSPPSFQAVSIRRELADDILEAIDRGIIHADGSKDLYTQAPAAKNRAAHKLVVQLAAEQGQPISEKDARKLVNEWIANQVLLEKSYTSEKRREPANGLIVNKRKRPAKDTLEIVPD